MTTNGWNSSCAGVGVRPFPGGHHPRPLYNSSFTMLECLKCDQKFLNFCALVDHYLSSHGDGNPPRQQKYPPAGGSVSSQTDRRDANVCSNLYQRRVSPSSVLQQRYHPYFPNNTRQQLPVSNPFTNTNHQFVVPPQTPQMLHPWYHPLANNQNSAVMTPAVNRLNTSHTINLGKQIPQPQVIPSMSRQMPEPQVTPSIGRQMPQTQVTPAMSAMLSRKSADEKGFDESADKKTIWYLGKLERQIPNIIDRESQDKKSEDVMINLTLKL